MSTDNTSSETTNVSAEQSEDISSALSDAGESNFVLGEGDKKPQANQWMILIALVLVGGGVAYFMYARKGPASADAAGLDNPQAVQNAQAQSTINGFLTDGKKNMKLMEQMLRNTEKVVKQFLEYPSMAQVPLEEVKNNPFRVTKEQAPDSEAATRKKREAERALALRAVGNLNLQSIMSGTRKSCMINNTLYTEGQQIDQFTIERIQSGIVIVKSGNFRFELKMQK